MSMTLSEEQALDILRRGRIEEKGLLPYSSNHSFLVLVHEDEWSVPAVYKPQRGENPLWDFEWGTLCKREAAAYEVSHALGWDLVPPTVLRDGTRWSWQCPGLHRPRQRRPLLHGRRGCTL